MRGKKIQLVLVADARRRRWLKDILQTGFVFLEACDVNEAVGLIRQKRRVDAIIVAPSRGRGLTTLRRLHADPLCHHIPLALLLENASAEEQEEAFLQGAVDVISLPAADAIIRARFSRMDYELRKQNTLRLLQRIVRRSMKQEDPDQIFLHFLKYLGMLSFLKGIPIPRTIGVPMVKPVLAAAVCPSGIMPSCGKRWTDFLKSMAAYPLEMCPSMKRKSLRQRLYCWPMACTALSHCLSTLTGGVSVSFVWRTCRLAA